MGDFGTAVKYLDWVKSRQATLLEAQSAPVPFDKYYNYQKSRALKKIPYVVNLPVHTLDATLYASYVPRILFQYSIVAPGTFHFVKLDIFDDALTINSCFICIRYILNNVVYRYAIKFNTIYEFITLDLFTFAKLYAGQIIQPQFFIEVWTRNAGISGLFTPVKLTLGLLVNPSIAEEIERPLVINGPFDYPTFSWNTPFSTPQDNPITDDIPAIPQPSHLLDEFGNFIDDEFGNRIVVSP